jgi:glycolate oxidase FAD binding subunit
MSRDATADDTVQGRLPQGVYEPETIAEAGAVLADLSREGKASVFVGGGTKLGLGPAPTRFDACVRTGKLSRIVEYSPSDQVVSVEAGITLSALQERLAQERQRLALDPPWPGRATLGGIVATNSFGPLRARSGAVRDLILGVSLIRADGVLARGGGRVVKNVAGFDLPKLVCGSLGTLGMIAAVTLRVHPLPEAAVSCVVPDLSAEAVRKLVEALRGAQLEPAALLARRGSAGWNVAMRFEGFGAGVAQQVSRLGSLGPAAESDEAPFEAHRRAREDASLRLKLAALPSALGAVEAAVAPLSALFPRAELSWYPTLGLGFFCAAADDGPSPVDKGGAMGSMGSTFAALAAARQQLQAFGGSLTIEAAPPALVGKLGAWESPRSLALHQAVKARFDPGGLLAPGRFVGGI